MATTTKHKKHKLTGNPQPQEFAVETVLLETAKQLGDYVHAQGKYESAIKDRDSAKEILNRLISQLHISGVKLGGLPRTGADTRYEGVKVTPAQIVTIVIYNAMPADISHAVKKNYLSALRVCIEKNIKFTLNPTREKAKGAKDVVAQKAPKSEDQKHGPVKQSLADVIRANFKTLLANNPALAAELAEELAELAGV